MKTIVAVLSTAAILAGASRTANAALTVDLATYGVAYGVPSVVPPTKFDLAYLNDFISLFNTGSPTSVTLTGVTDGPTFALTKDQGSSTPNPSLPSATSIGSNISVDNSPTSFTINLGAGGYTYLVGGWDGPQGSDAVYYIAGLSGEITLKNDVPGYSQKGLSNYWLAVPEPTTFIAGALLLLPFGASTARILRRKQGA